jgi:hypothetical protein
MFTAVIDRPGDSFLELTPLTNSCRWDSAAVGGFGSCTFTVPGSRTARDLPYLGIVRLYYGTQQLWEGRIEDHTFNIGSDTISTTVQAFGWKRALDFTVVQRIWSKRDINWREISVHPGGLDAGGNTLRRKPENFTVTTGIIDPANLTKSGVEARGIDGSPVTNAGYCNLAYYIAPVGLTIVRVMGTIANGGGSIQGILGSTADGTTWSTDYSNGTGIPAAFSQALAAPATQIRCGIDVGAAAYTTASTDFSRFYDMRLLGTTLTEDAAGGFYGGTILRDLVALCPDLKIGIVEDGSDFTVQSIERAVHDPSTGVVQEVASYYAREWAVWEGGRFDWITPNLDEPQFVLNVADCTELELGGSLDTLVKRSYVLYNDAASGVESFATADATSQRNPFVRTGSTKDDITAPGFPMTANTATQLAARIAVERGGYPPITGRITIPATKLIKDENGQQVPAFAIRAGRNVYIPDLPRDEVLSQGRDGQTLFHVATAEADMTSMTVTLELEGQGRQMDVILARLAAATRTLTG